MVKVRANIMPQMAQNLGAQDQNKKGRAMTRISGIVALAASAALLSGPSRAAEESEATTPAELGKDAYMSHCAVCHGLEGYGNGPLADAMKIAPSDLTRIAAKHDGKFPSDKVADVIRNGGGVLGHGSPSMPAWGLYFAEKGKPEVARERIRALVAYIEGIQEK
jgi:mono/diheme cytochrome c family protein